MTHDQFFFVTKQVLPFLNIVFMKFIFICFKKVILCFLNQVAVPKIATDQDLAKVAEFRSRQRLPVRYCLSSAVFSYIIDGKLLNSTKLPE